MAEHEEREQMELEVSENSVGDATTEEFNNFLQKRVEAVKKTS